jgi:hypothetical protein
MRRESALSLVRRPVRVAHFGTFMCTKTALRSEPRCNIAGASEPLTTIHVALNRAPDPVTKAD